jgi:hypothetical protein
MTASALLPGLLLEVKQRFIDDVLPLPPHEEYIQKCTENRHRKLVFQNIGELCLVPPFLD